MKLRTNFSGQWDENKLGFAELITIDPKVCKGKINKA